MLASKVKHDWMKGDFIGLYRSEEKNEGSNWRGAY